MTKLKSFKILSGDEVIYHDSIELNDDYFYPIFSRMATLKMNIFTKQKIEKMKLCFLLSLQIEDFFANHYHSNLKRQEDYTKQMYSFLKKRELIHEIEWKGEKYLVTTFGSFTTLKNELRTIQYHYLLNTVKEITETLYLQLCTDDFF